MLIDGEAGIGKSRLLERFTELVQGYPGQLLEGACLPFLQTVPYAPILRIAEALTSGSGPPPSAVGDSLLPDPTRRSQFFQQIADGLAAAAAEATVAIMVEDLHWADEATADLLLFLARGIKRLSVLLVLTRRSDELSRAGRLDAALAELERGGHAERIRLTPLDRRQTIDLLTGLLDAEPPPEAVRRIASRADGNPFYVEELMAAGPGNDLPETVHELIRDRLGRLSAVAQKVVEAAAVVGRPVEDPLLQAVADLPPAEVHAGIAEALAHHLLVIDRHSYAFRHALVGESVDQLILPWTRRARHERAALALTQHPAWSAVRSPGGIAAELAAHWLAAGRLPEAFQASLAAARAADDAQAPAEAHLHYQRTLDLWDQVTDPTGLVRSRREDILLPAAQAASLAGHHAEAQGLARTLLERLDPDVDTHEYALALTALATYLWRGARIGETARVSRELASRLPAETGETRVVVLEGLADIHTLSGRHLAALAYGEQAMHEARKLGKPELIAIASEAVGRIRCLLGCPDGLDLMRQSLHISREIGAGYGIARTLVNQVGVLVGDDRPYDALALAGPAVAELRQLGLESSALPFLIGCQLTALIDVGRWDEADRIASGAVQGLPPVDAVWPQVAYAFLLLRRGLFSRAAALIQAATAGLGDEHDVFRGVSIARVAGELALWQGKFTEARSAIERGLALLRDTDDAAWLLRITALGAQLEADAVDDSRLAGQSVDVTRARQAVDRHVRAAREQVDRIERTVNCHCDSFHRWTDLTEAEAARIAEPSAPARWATIATSYEFNPYLVAYARWRQAEALLARPETRTGAGAPLLTAHQTAMRLQAAPLLGKIVDLAARAANAVLVTIGDKLGLYRAMVGAGPLEPAQLAARTGTAERYVREWLAAQAAGGYLDYHPDSGRYSLPPEHAMALAVEDSPVFLQGGFDVIGAVVADEPKITDAFRTGDGVGWHEHDQRLYGATERFFRPGYRANLVSSWIPALDGVQQRLREGIVVADVGCGHGASTILLAEAFPASTFIGYDYHPTSVEAARARAERAGVADRVQVRGGQRQGLPVSGRRLRPDPLFDCLHDMGDPVGGLRHARSCLGDAGTVMLVEPPQATASRTTSTRSAGSSTRPRPRSAHRRHWTRRSASRSAHRPVRPNWRRSLARPASPRSASPPVRRSTSCSRPAAEAEHLHDHSRTNPWEVRMVAHECRRSCSLSVGTQL